MGIRFMGILLVFQKQERKLSVNNLEKSNGHHNPFPCRKRVTLKNNLSVTLPLH